MNISWQAEVFALMKDNNISRNDLAEAAGVTPEYVSMVLNKRRNPAGAESNFRAAIQKLLHESASKGVTSMTDDLSNIPTEQLVSELCSRDEVEAESKRYLRSAECTITLRLKLAKTECPACLQLENRR